LAYRLLRGRENKQVENIDFLIEPEVAKVFVLTVIDEVKRVWSNILDILERDFRINNGKTDDALFELILAVVAYELYSLENLVAKEQANRLITRTIGFLGSPAEARINKYIRKIQFAHFLILSPNEVLGIQVWKQWNISGFISSTSWHKESINRTTLTSIIECVQPAIGVWRDLKSRNLI
jgi:hypothetical protein